MAATSEAVKTYDNYIGGEWRPSSSGKLLEIFDPGNGELVFRGADAIEYYAGLARNVYGRSTMLAPDSLAILLREPVGVVAIIVPWNMALSLLTRPLGPALAAGNAVVIKPSSATPGATAEFVKMIDDIPEFPKGIVNMVVGPGSTTGAELVKHPDVDMVNFTGDTNTGKDIMKMAADTLK